MHADGSEHGRNYLYPGRLDGSKPSESPPAAGRMANVENLYLGLGYSVKDQVV
jgi:hypothetical protein